MNGPYRDLIASTCLIVLASAGPVFGWGDEGHEIVATVAANVLKEESPATV